MSILAMILIGLVVGIIAKFLMPGDDPGGMIVTILLGIAGAWLAGYAGRAMGWYNEGEPVGFLASVGGAIILLLLYRVIFGRRRRMH
ncbi:MAG: GlsB/YeaQ/YmgE family stress response membrane protein [Opitutus sp.]|nr:GlsB/YeaQ/YmgE family stress response membrane protein [Opitutus sp.]